MSSNEAYSEQWRLASIRWVELSKRFRLMEAHESHFLNKRKEDLGDIPDSHAERKVKASDWWKTYRTDKVEAWADAELASIHAESIRMRYWEHQSGDANRRSEMRL